MFTGLFFLNISEGIKIGIDAKIKGIIGVINLFANPYTSHASPPI